MSKIKSLEFSKFLLLDILLIYSVASKPYLLQLRCTKYKSNDQDDISVELVNLWRAWSPLLTFWALSTKVDKIEGLNNRGKRQQLLIAFLPLSVNFDQFELKINLNKSLFVPFYNCWTVWTIDELKQSSADFTSLFVPFCKSLSGWTKTITSGIYWPLCPFLQVLMTLNYRLT